MISLPNPTQSPISRSLTAEQRERAKDLLCERWLESMTLRDLEVYFYDTNREYLESYSEAELISELEDYTTDEEFQEFMNEA
jgi:hypothetical protein